MERYASTVIGYQRDQETPDEAIRATSDAGLAQVEGWVLTAVEKLTARYPATSAPFGYIALASTVQRPLLRILLARLVDNGALVWADDGGYLPA